MSDVQGPQDTPPALHSAGDKVLARDQDGLLYAAFVRRSLWGVQHQTQMNVMTAVAGKEESGDKKDEEDEPEKQAEWHYFVQ